MTDKNLGGRPPFYKTPEELEEAIEKFFEENTGIEYDEEGNIKSVKAPTVSGLALHLGFSDRASIYDYKAKEAFTHTIKRAITKIEQFAESQLFNAKSPTGAIFWLKNHGWYDKKEVEHSGEVKATVSREDRQNRIGELLRKKGN